MSGLSNKDKSAILAFLAFAGVLVVLSIVLRPLSPLFGLWLLVPAAMLGAILGYFVFLVLPVAIHELGHYAVGAILGIGFSGIDIGPFCWSVENRRIRFKFNRNHLGGRVYPVRSKAAYTPLKLIIMVLGGPAMNLIAVILSLHVADNVNPHLEPLPLFLEMFATANGVLVLYFLMTDGSEENLSDLGLLKRYCSRSGRRSLRAYRLILDEVSRLPKDYDPTLIEQLAEPTDEISLKLWAESRRFYHLLHSQKFERAGESLRVALTLCGGLEEPNEQSNDMLLEGASFYAGYLGDHVRARELLGRVPHLSDDGFRTARRALIALDYCEGRMELADRRIERALANSNSDSLVHQIERDFLETLRSWHKSR